MAEKKSAAPAAVIGKKKNIVVPGKTTMNFAHHKSSVNLKRLIPIAVILIAVVLLGVKFGILNQLNKKIEAQNELSSRQATYTAMAARLAEYDALAEQYGRYSYGWMSETETSLVDRMEIVSLIEKNVMNVAAVEDFSISKNVLTINLHGVTLNQTSAIVDNLEKSELVDSAAVYNASANDGSEAVVFMTVILTKEVAEQ